MDARAVLAEKDVKVPVETPRIVEVRPEYAVRSVAGALSPRLRD